MLGDDGDTVFVFVALSVGSFVELRSKAGVPVVNEREKVCDGESDGDVDKDTFAEPETVMLDRLLLTSDFERDIDDDIEEVWLVVSEPD